MVYARTIVAAILLLGAAVLRAEEVSLSGVEAPEYVYTPSVRDPFLPLSGGTAARINLSAAEGAPKEAFNPATVELKGILRTPTARFATLVSTTGERYIVENGKVMDAKRKPIEGIVGIIKEKSLVLIGRDNQVTELRMKRNQDDSDKTR
jgi:hypothetical protein